MFDSGLGQNNVTFFKFFANIRRHAIKQNKTVIIKTDFITVSRRSSETENFFTFCEVRFPLKKSGLSGGRVADRINGFCRQIPPMCRRRRLTNTGCHYVT